MDRYCYLAKNLSNSVNYLLKQCYRIHRKLAQGEILDHRKLAQGEILDSWEKGMIYRANCAVRRYNRARPGKRPLKYIDGNGSLTADAYFLSWYMKTWEVYRAMPYATCSHHALCHMQPDLHPGEMQGMEILFQGAAGIPQGPARLLRPSKGAGIPGPCLRPGEDRHHEPELLGR